MRILALLVLLMPILPAAEIVSPTAVGTAGPRNLDSDLISHDGKLYLVYTESSGPYAQDSVLQVHRSSDGVKWEPVAKIVSTTPGKGLHSPRFTKTPEGLLSITGCGVVPNPESTQPIPQYGGRVRSMAWTTKDGKTWSEAELIGPKDYPFSRTVWHGKTALTFSRGCICGIMQTVHVNASTDGKQFDCKYEKTFSDFFPEDGAVAFDGDTAYVLMTRSTGAPNERLTAFLGSSKAPYDNWEWAELKQSINEVNFLRLKDGQLIAAFGLQEGGKKRTAIGHYDLAKGIFKELVELPAGAVHAGLAEHDGHLWASFHVNENNKWIVKAAKVKLK